MNFQGLNRTRIQQDCESVKVSEEKISLHTKKRKIRWFCLMKTE